MSENKFKTQSDQYSFPYHYIPISSKEDYSDLVISRRMDWGLEYLFILDSVAKRICDGSSVLDVGCGDGRLYSRLGLSLNTFQYLGIDLDKQPIDLANAINPDGKFISGSIFELEGCYDYLTMVEVLEHISDEQVDDFLTTLKKNMHSDSKLIITVPSTLRKLHKKHYRHYDMDLLSEQLLRNGFEIVEMQNCYCETKLSSFITKLYSNSFYTINNAFLKKVILKLVLRIAKRNQNGAHLLCTASVK